MRLPQFRGSFLFLRNFDMQNKFKSFGKPISVMAMSAAMIVGLVAAKVPLASDTSKTIASKPLATCISGSGFNTQVIDEQSLLADDHGSYFLFKVSGCRLNDFDTPVFRYFGATRICKPIDVRLSLLSQPGFESPCFIDSITPITKDEATALKAKDKKN
jgi:hypothetical protein